MELIFEDLSARRKGLAKLLSELSEFVYDYKKPTKGFKIDEAFVLGRFVREVAGQVIPARNQEGEVAPLAFLGQKTDHVSLEASLARDCVIEYIWPTVRLALKEDSDEIEALLFRLAKVLIEKESAFVTSRIIQNFDRERRLSA